MDLRLVIIEELERQAGGRLFQMRKTESGEIQEGIFISLSGLIDVAALAAVIKENLRRAH